MQQVAMLLPPPTSYGQSVVASESARPRLVAGGRCWRRHLLTWALRGGLLLVALRRVTARQGAFVLGGAALLSGVLHWAEDEDNVRRIGRDPAENGKRRTRVRHPGALL